MPALTDHQLPLVQTRGTHSLHACMFSCACMHSACAYAYIYTYWCVCVCVCVHHHTSTVECDISLFFLPFPCYSPSVLPLLPPPPPPLFPPPPPSPPPSPAPSLRSSRKRPRTVTSTVMCPEKPFRFRRTGRSCAKTVQSGVEKVSVLRACVCARLSEVGERKRGKREREKERDKHACMRMRLDMIH
jgi:hypothetical protein